MIRSLILTSMKNEKIDFKHYLRSELIRRCQKNPGYSMRAFARNLEIDGSTLSKILRGKRPLGEKTITYLGLKLGLKKSEISKFLKFRSNEAKTLTEYDFIEDDIFSVISDWYYYAILELMRVDQFKMSTQSISKALGITVHEAADAVERLQRLEMIKIENNVWTDLTSGRSTNITAQTTTTARRTQQKQILTKAITAIDNVTPAQRSNTSMTFAIDTSRLEEANELIKNFRREMGELLSRGENRDEVYNLAIALYPVSEIKKK